MELGYFKPYGQKYGTKNMHSVILALAAFCNALSLMDLLT